MPSLSLPILLVVVAGPAAPEQPPGEETTGPPLRQVVQRSTEFLEKEGAAWMKKQQCASCHHIPAMVWALSEARQRGYRVNEKLLGEVTSWALAADSHAQVFPDLPLDKKRTETDYLGPLLMALGVGAIEGRDAAVEQARQRLLAHAVSQQVKDGSWHANSGGRPPVHASRDVQTSWLLLALSDPAEGKVALPEPAGRQPPGTRDASAGASTARQVRRRPEAAPGVVARAAERGRRLESVEDDEE
jgi:squalene-hopene/tetraprenyl-beta-curcumene cyclase